MQVLKDTSPPGRKVVELEDLLRAFNIQIYSRNELFVKVDGTEYEVKDIDGGSGGSELPRELESERLVLTQKGDRDLQCIVKQEGVPDRVYNGFQHHDVSKHPNLIVLTVFDGDIEIYEADSNEDRRNVVSEINRKYKDDYNRVPAFLQFYRRGQMPGRKMTPDIPFPLICVGCGKAPDQLNEYVEAAQELHISPEQYVINEEGTLNIENGHFVCTPCYVHMGCPSSPTGWKAP